MLRLEGGPPETEADWRRVADTLGRLHRLTQGWPQRVALIGWNELHVEVPDLDLVLPHNVAGLDGGTHDIAISRRLLGRRVRNQAACRSSSGLSLRIDLQLFGTFHSRGGFPCFN
jgi:hypothetical protein